LYSGNRILTEDYDVMDIEKVNLKLNLVHACAIDDKKMKITFRLPPGATSDLAFFHSVIVDRWRLELRDQWKDDEDYTDYLPAYYNTLQDLVDENLIIVHDSDDEREEDEDDITIHEIEKEETTRSEQEIVAFHVDSC